MSPAPRLLAKAECLRVLRRAGYPVDVAAEMDALLPDPVDIERDGPLLARHGVDMETLVDRLGGSP